MEYKIVPKILKIKFDMDETIFYIPLRGKRPIRQSLCQLKKCILKNVTFVPKISMQKLYKKKFWIDDLITKHKILIILSNRVLKALLIKLYSRGATRTHTSSRERARCR